MNVVLHVCCGVCAAGAIIQLLDEGYQIAGYFYNPNIHPREEYERRLEAARVVFDNFKIPLHSGIYDSERWFDMASGLAKEPEGGKRCEGCFRLRLQETYMWMLSKGADMFTSTLTVGPRKSALAINRLGAEIGGLRYLGRDFKKKDGFRKACSVAGELGIYRQNYCGCIYSMRKESL